MNSPHYDYMVEKCDTLILNMSEYMSNDFMLYHTIPVYIYIYILILPRKLINAAPILAKGVSGWG